MKRFFASLWEILEVVLIAVVTVFIIRNFLAQPFLVSGASMENNFSHGNYLLIDEITYRFRDPQRGEVVVFRSPLDNSTFFIKRIVGLPGEKLSIEDSKLRLFDDQGSEVALDEHYLLEEKTGGELDISLNHEEYVVLGDNRSNSFDSRNWGPLPRKNIVGLVRLRLFPFDEIGIIRPPALAM